MFENLLGQDETLVQLKVDLEAQSLPASILFTGPEASGKLTTALELSRVLSCQETGETAPRAPGEAAWNCPCPSCMRHRLLVHPDLLLMGPRGFPEEIPAALALFGRVPAKASAFFFLRAIRKLTKRFDAALYEGEENRLSKAAPLLREIEEKLDLIRPEELPAQAGLAMASADSEAFTGSFEAARAAAELARKLEAFVPDTTPVFMVRSAGYWARLAPNGRMKTIVIENADRMLEGARNALLKILEEPPSSLEFVLVTPRRNAMMATILSRVRPYSFKARSPAEEALVLERVFKAQVQAGAAGARRGESAITAFLHAQRAFPPAEARRRARAFLLAATSRLRARADASGTALDPALEYLASLQGGELDPAFAALAESGASPYELGEAALATLSADTKDFGARDDSFSSSFPSFLEALASLLGETLRRPDAGADALVAIEGWAELVRDAKTQYQTWNRSPALLAESLLYAMGGA